MQELAPSAATAAVLVASGGAPTRISLAIHHDQRWSSPVAPIAQADRTATGASIDYRISTPYQIGPWDLAVGTTTPGFGSLPVAADRVVAKRPPFAPGSQTVALGSAP